MDTSRNLSWASVAAQIPQRTNLQGDRGSSGFPVRQNVQTPVPVSAHRGPINMQPDHTSNKRTDKRNKFRRKKLGLTSSDASTNQKTKQTNKPPISVNGSSLNNSENIPSTSRSSQQKERRARSCKGLRPNAQPERRFNVPIEISLYDLIKSSEQQTPKRKTAELVKSPVDKTTPNSGKTRESTKRKRHTKLKRIILDERATRKLKRSMSVPASVRLSVPQLDATFETGIGQLGSPTNKTNIPQGISVLNYQNQLVAELLKKLSLFQDRAYVSNPNSPFLQKRAKRFVCGLREVTKYLKLNNLKIVIVARDLEGKAVQKLQVNKTGNTTEKSEGHDTNCSSDHSILEDVLSKIWDLATDPDHHTPILIAHTRKQLASFCHKPAGVSVIGILSFEGALDIAKQLLGLNSAVNLGWGSDVQLKKPPNDLTHTEETKTVLAPISEAKEPQFDMVVKLREAIKQMYLHENKPAIVANQPAKMNPKL